MKELLKRYLWESYGNQDSPAEWDGHIHGGSKVSQRYWEYLVTIDLLDLEQSSVLLDIGGGGTGFFAQLIASHIEGLVVIDPNFSDNLKQNNKVEIMRQWAGPQSLKECFDKYPITHVSSISVLEHMTDEARADLCRGLNEYFAGNNIVFTFEYHPLMIFRDTFLTQKSMSAMLSQFNKFYLADFLSCPTRSINSYSEMLDDNGNLAGSLPNWYPVAVKMVRWN